MTSEIKTPKPTITKSNFHIPRMAFPELLWQLQRVTWRMSSQQSIRSCSKFVSGTAPTAEWQHCGQSRNRMEATSSNSEACIAASLANVHVARKSLPSAAPNKWNRALSTGYPQTMKKARTEA